VSDDLKLFRVEYDGGDYYIEAPSMQRAIDVWHLYMSTAPATREWWDTDTEPRVVALVHDRPVIRGIILRTATVGTVPS